MHGLLSIFVMQIAEIPATLFSDSTPHTRVIHIAAAVRHTHVYNSMEMHFVIIHPSVPRSPKWCLPFRFPNCNYVLVCIYHLPLACYISHLSHLDNI